ncbi:MAG: sulfite exporter TauE/SafE family protein [Actinomycetota bacterium]|nr:sulfite exporter TauE/SafE family protein [Actinomycetota bacterium]
MDVLQLLLLAAIGVIGGTLSGLVGVGGGIIFVPGLLFAGGWAIQEAVAASLVIIVFSSLSGTIRNASSEDPVNWRTAGLLSLVVAPSSLIGVAISRVSPETVVEVVFSLLMLSLAYPTARGRSELGVDGKRLPLPLTILAGVFVGTLSGLVGVGGGVMLVPLMVLGLGLEVKTAVSTSLAIVLFTSLVGASGYLLTGFSDVLRLPPLVIGAIVGAWLGVRIRDPLPEDKLRIGFAVFMVVVALRILGQAAGIF